MSTFWTPPFFLVLLSMAVSTIAIPSSLTILHNSGESDGHFQTALVKGALLGIRDAATDLEPALLNLDHFDPEKGVDWIISNGSTTLISLLSSNQLNTFCNRLVAQELNHTLHIFTPRSLSLKSITSKFITITSLEMSQQARIMALLHRIKKVGTESLLTVMEDETQFSLLEAYTKTASRIFPQLKFMPPVLMTQTSSWTSHSSFEFLHPSTNATGQQQGILLLSRNGINVEDQKRMVEQNHFFRWFSHESFHEWGQGGSGHEMFGLYSVQYVGSKNWDNPHRRKILKELNLFTGPSPSIFSSALAYDTARMAVNHFRNHPIESNTEASFSPYQSGVTGDLRFINQMTRSDGVFFGFLSLPYSKRNSFSNILQPSDWVLEDVLEMSEENGFIKFGKARLATTSILSRTELLELARKGSKLRKCEQIEMDFLTHDPFNQIAYRYTFVEKTLPPHVLIPNEYGYGIEFRCKGRNFSSGPITVLKIACTPDPNSNAQHVDCFTSGVKIRSKRSQNYYYQPVYEPPKGANYNQPVDNSWNPLHPHSQNSNYKNYQEISHNSAPNPSTKTRKTGHDDLPVKKNLFLPGGEKNGADSDIRQFIKSAKPFVGSCMGSATGCAVCMIVLGNFPVGAMPTSCYGSCFLGTFGVCGGLLGRAISETTVICTELFRQGYLDVDTFLADAEFGRKLGTESPKTLLGYQTLATPLVKLMRESQLLTQMVAYFALPWTTHMKHLIGHSDQFSWSGYFVHTIGSAFSYVFGHLLTFLSGSRLVESLGYSVMGLFISRIFSITKLGQ